MKINFFFQGSTVNFFFLPPAARCFMGCFLKKLPRVASGPPAKTFIYFLRVFRVFC